FRPKPLSGSQYLNKARQIGIVETISISDTLVGHDLQIFSAERMARIRGEIRERHPECAANLRVEMVNLAGEAIGRQPLGHGVRVEEGAKNLLRPGGEDTMQTNGIALGHDVIFSITERNISQESVG